MTYQNTGQVMSAICLKLARCFLCSKQNKQIKLFRRPKYLTQSSYPCIVRSTALILENKRRTGHRNRVQCIKETLGIKLVASGLQGRCCSSQNVFFSFILGLGVGLRSPWGCSEVVSVLRGDPWWCHESIPGPVYARQLINCFTSCTSFSGL